MLSLNGKTLPITMFPDNTSQVWKLDEWILKETNYVYIEWKYSHEGEFLQLAQLKALLDTYKIRAGLKLTYLPYGRQDKDVLNSATFALRPFAQLLNFLNFDEVIIMDPHSKVALDLINNSRAVYPVEQVMAIAYDLKIGLFCYPDEGAVDKYTGGDNVQNEIYDYPCIWGEKVRDQLTGNITSYKLIGKCSGKNVLIVDDICDGGATFKLLAKDLLAAGANSVVLFVTHGIFSKGTRTLFESGIQRIFTLDGEVSERQGSIQF